VNHLAHLFLADPGAESLAGNLSGDFVKGPLGDRFPPGIADGIRQHRRVDAYTDSHPAVAAFRRVLIPDHGHYARVIADMFFDHFLAVRFTELGGEPLEEFLVRTWAAIDPLEPQLPGRLRWVYPHLRDDQWILSYRTHEGIHDALAGISRRFRRPVHLETATRHLADSRRELERRFDDFWQDISTAGL
jgi:acyl carrier protein phosphodiesterase